MKSGLPLVDVPTCTTQGCSSLTGDCASSKQQPQFDIAKETLTISAQAICEGATRLNPEPQQQAQQMATLPAACMSPLCIWNQALSGGGAWDPTEDCALCHDQVFNLHRGCRSQQDGGGYCVTRNQIKNGPRRVPAEQPDAGGDRERGARRACTVADIPAIESEHQAVLGPGIWKCVSNFHTRQTPTAPHLTLHDVLGAFSVAA